MSAKETFMNFNMETIILDTWRSKLGYVLNYKDIEELERIINYYKEEVQELKKQLSSITLQLETQQKGFIEWLEYQVKLQEKLNDNHLATGFEEILSKYKEITGVKDAKN